MMILPLSKLGASEPTPGTLTFGVFLPTISPGNARSVSVQIVREVDAMLQEIASVPVSLTYSLDPTYGEYWSGTVTLSGVAAPVGSTWGSPGTYLYWYQVVLNSGLVIDHLIDPFLASTGSRTFRRSRSGTRRERGAWVTLRGRRPRSQT